MSTARRGRQGLPGLRSSLWLAGAASHAVALALTGVVRIWQLVGSLLVAMFGLGGGYDRQCRFYPSCSEYAVQALRVHGPWRGGGLSLRRLGRCHPWNPGGVDLVPPRTDTPARGA